MFAITAGPVRLSGLLTREIQRVRAGSRVSVVAATALARQGGTMKMPESLLLAADTALYKAKNGGRNRVATALLVASRNG